MDLREGRRIMSDTVDISVRGLRKVFDEGENEVLAIDKIDFEVKRSEILSVVGPSGCGKTTLLRLLQGLIEPSAGTITIDPKRRCAGTAYIQQSPALLPWRTVLQNAAIGLELKGRCTRDAIQGVSARLDRWELGQLVNQLTSKLSGGEKQRVDIIRSLESKPALLFCDEPFSAIDYITRFRLSTEFKKLCRLEEVTVVFVTHNIEDAIFLSDEIVVLSRRPARVVAIHRPRLEIGSEDALKCRESPSFEPLLKTILDQFEK